MKRKKFKLSPTGKLAASMAIILATCSVSFANNITPGGDAAHRPDVNQANTGATVVNIVAPSESGLSYNQYNEFNVNERGAVLNNSLIDGQSQLAGQLSANSNLNGRTATVILNEVISRNPSLLLGKQEIFGMAADYVLANPNGITCNGCGFINTNQASLVVGNPLVDNGILQGFSNFNNQNTLNIRNNGLSHGDVLNLIAPKINSNGQIVTSKDLNITTGNNKVSADGRILASQPARIGALDSYYLGSMQAGRIRLLNTAEGSGVNLEGKMTADNSIDITSLGDVKLEAATLQGGDIAVQGKNILSQGFMHRSSSNTLGDDNSEGRFKGQYTQQKQISESVARTQLTGKNITLVAKQDNKVMATDIKGDNVKLTGANLALEGQQLHQFNSDTNNKWQMSWQYDVTKEDEKYQYEGNTITARENVHLTANEGNAEVLGSKIDAGNQLSVSAKKGVKLAGLVESDMVKESGYKKNHQASLQTGYWNDINTSQRNVDNELRSGGDLGIKAGENVDIVGTRIHSDKNMIVSAGQKTNIAVQSLVNEHLVTKDKTYWGGLAGGSNKNNSDKSETHHASEVTANGHLLLSGVNGITITGSKIKAQKGAYVEANDGHLTIDNAVSHLSKTVDERKGTIFNITKNTNQEQNKQQKSSGSYLSSDTELKLLSNKDINVIGSLAKSAGELQLNTSGNINILNYGEKNQSQQTKSDLQWHYYTKETQDKQYRAGIGFEHSLNKQENASTAQKSSELNGGTLVMNSGQNVTVTGSHLVTKQGDAKITGNNISLLAGENNASTSTSQEKLQSNVFITGGMDKLGSGAEGVYNRNNQYQRQTTSTVAQTRITGNLELNAKGELKQQGTDHQVQGTYQANAGSIKNVATSNTEFNSTEQLQVGGEINGTADYSSTTRPVEKTAKAAADSKLDMSISKTRLPNVGIELAMNGSSRYTNSHQSNAVVTSVKAGDIKATTTGDIYDQGTQYQARKDSVSLTAGSHTSEAAFNQQNSYSADTKGDGRLRVYTTTGADISVNGKGSGSYQETSHKNSSAVTSNINAHNNVNVQVTRDARYQATSFKANNGSANIDAGGNIQFNHATNRNEQKSHGYNAEVSLTAGTNPDGNNFSGSLGGGYNTDHQNNTTAQTSAITGERGVNLHAGNNLALQGTQVSGKQVGLTAQRGKIDLTSAQDTAYADGWNFGAKANGGTSSLARKNEGADTAADNNATGIIDNKYNMGGELKFGVNQLTQTTHRNTQISGNNLTLTSGGDTSLKGANVTAGEVTGKIGGNFNVESLKDSTHSLNVGLDAGLGYSRTVKGDNLNKLPAPPVATDNAKAEGENPGLKEQLAATFKGFKGKLKGNYDTLDRESIGEQTALTGNQRVNLDIANKTSLVAGKIDSAQGSVVVNTQQIHQQSVAGYDRSKNMGVNLPDSIAGLAFSAQKDFFSGKVPFVKNESNNTELPAVNSNMKGYKLD
ncbi:filamentous hemagglutinin N-terminal domain-containing protein [Xenorhabdus sp. 12]|uniref:Filamentous hemagglutinin N-terminal domain-containing protein n=1 Tax=Xenorhabdus santafensis TaxID=2582833 RepID=A0ABU4S5C0_9GAMM|nr:hemagglutinin repeat-containing protein [Xenorhabdus sp. 12]MDX7986206.1 filamentous hemagglutinin N-terminal domain-containing protein [Xenorhabdus sp. 12]